ncbi:glycosyltransferase family 2 protein [Noviherbaspirillum galbum]|uniref:Glycosyltransferase family 2 protein n=1 Tax=Noviherbaspirillum galbum TaxID=2709383 RepID=A0A6B3SZ96_9BURK|nr:glycosyltransferase family 2 protein [Noviherbaspirillum galbum]NEX64482.1 glycosyltransferase family 2 protein [Noviherbaspirillum galbum]
MRISCSVVSYHNPPDQLGLALRSVAASHAAVDLWLVDNSRDTALESVAREAGARYLHLPANPGFGAAHNLAIRQALESGSDYHLVMNPDVWFGPEVIPAMTAYLDAHPDIGLLMPDIRYPDGSRQHLCKLLPNPADLIVRRFLPGLYRLSGRLARYELHDSGYDRVMDVPALSGCFMLLRASVLRRIGGFDERFFLYMEDVDLSRRVGEVARTVYYPLVSITHGYQKGSYKNATLLSHHIRSALRYFGKWGWLADARRRRVNRLALAALERPRDAVPAMDRPEK